tara:strand:+ start:1026 stop:1475 length:450 start_codon:yes stop_codon:yes gene_type:complete
VSGGKNKVIEDVSKQVKVLSEEDTINGKKVSENTRELFYQLKERLLEWDEVTLNSKTHYISFKRGKKVFAYFNFRKNYIRIHMGSHIKTKWDGSREKTFPTNKFVLDDPKKMFEIWESDYKALYSYDIKDDKDLDYFLLMVKQKYDSVG